MSLLSIRWDIEIVAMSSIVHREDSSSLGADTFVLFRRESIISPSGEILQVPILSGSGFRGILRRIGEALTAEVLDYEGAGLPIPAAHLLTNGGRLAKSARPITDEQERRLKTLLPQIAVFGGAASGRIMSGLLAVGKVLPEFAELAHILPRPPKGALITAVLGVGEEPFSHLDDYRPQHSPSTDNTVSGPVNLDETDSTASAGTASERNHRAQSDSPLGRFSVETLPAGTRLQTWVTMSNATDSQIAFFLDVLNTFAEHGHLGGRVASGHGRIRATITPTVLRGQLPDAPPDWRAELADKRTDAIAALSELS